MTDIDAAEYLRELKDAALENKLITGPNPTGVAAFYDCALMHAIRALEERHYPPERRLDPTTDIAYQKLPNGSYRHAPPTMKE